IGQRKGIGVAAPEPLYVTGLDAARARVVVGPKAALARDRLSLRDVNWLGTDPGDSAMPVNVKLRSTRPAVPALLRLGARAEVELESADHGISPGQACVFYDGAGAGARLLGGGTIDRASLGSA